MPNPNAANPGTSTPNRRYGDGLPRSIDLCTNPVGKRLYLLTNSLEALARRINGDALAAAGTIDEMAQALLAAREEISHLAAQLGVQPQHTKNTAALIDLGLRAAGITPPPHQKGSHD